MGDKMFAVTWTGGSDGVVEINTLEELKGETFSLPKDFIREIEKLSFGESAVTSLVTQSIAVMRISDECSKLKTSLLPDSKVIGEIEKIIEANIKHWPDCDWIGIGKDWYLNLYIKDDYSLRCDLHRVTDGHTHCNPIILFDPVLISANLP